jgi:hypothetical protein
MHATGLLISLILGGYFSSSVVKKWPVGEAYSILEKIDKGEDSWVIDLSDIPGGAKAIELAAIYVLLWCKV